MIQGLERFREHFQDLESSYLLIGGVATQLVLDEAGLPSRATKDLDIGLCAEARDRDRRGEPQRRTSHAPSTICKYRATLPTYPRQLL